jgi:Peptidase M50B-like
MDLVYVGIAAVLAVLLSHLPLIDTVIYPFKLFGTFVHEWCHAIVAIATGGQVRELQINSDLSGETVTAGGWLLPIFSAGYTGAAIVGALLLLIPTRFANRVLMGIGVASILMPLLGGVLADTTFPASTWLWTAIFGAVTLLVGARAPARIAGIFQQFVAIELCFTALDSLRQLAVISIDGPSQPTDAWNAQHYFVLPELAWTALWAIIAVAAIAFAAFRVVRRSIA